MAGPEPADDELKWFGEGFDGFPKKLPENVVEYIILILDNAFSDVRTRERLQAFQRALTTIQKKFLKEYIWQREPISIDLVREDGRWMLKGRTDYGDSVADEWLIVWLLRELSKEFKDAWIRIYDSDGEFLLIEAANALPNWLNPEVAEHRVWINGHQLLVIPLDKRENPRPLQFKEAILLISGAADNTKHFPKIEHEAFHRLKSYPAVIAENQHHATLSLPRKVAHILHISPAYIAPIVEAFYLRDPISLRLLQPSKSKIQLIFPPEDFVSVSVRFTKVLYAQLLGQKWSPAGPFGEALENLLRQSKDQTARDKAEISIKVSAGLEMLMQHSIYASRKPVREIKVLLDDLEAGDDTLPADDEIADWPQREDDEGWLNIDFAEFERELDGKGGGTADGFGDKNAQENLRKMVERFSAFMTDENAGLEGASGLDKDPMDSDDDSEDGDARRWEDPEDSDGAEDDSDGNEFADAEFAEYSAALDKFMTLSSAEKSALTDAARELATAEEAEKEEDEEIEKLAKMMEEELFSHGALKLNTDMNGTRKGSANKKLGATTGASTPKGKGKAKAQEQRDTETGSIDDDDEDDDLLDEDYNLADNMLKSFSGQVGMPGPAGNLMGLMGIQFPPDADDEAEGRGGPSGSRKK